MGCSEHRSGCHGISDMSGLDKELLDILVCPKSKAPLVEVGDWLYSTDPGTRLRYPVRNGIPIMLIEEAETVEQEEFEKIVGAAARSATDSKESHAKNEEHR